MDRIKSECGKYGPEKLRIRKLLMQCPCLIFMEVALASALEYVYSKDIWELFDEAYLGLCQTSKMEYFCKNS